MGDKSAAAIASTLAGEIYGLKVLQADVEDEHHNATRFLIMSRADERAPNTGKVVTTFVFQVKNVPAALYKALGAFATNGVNMTKLESYQLGGSFNATQFYADIQGHPDAPNVAAALKELESRRADDGDGDLSSQPFPRRYALAVACLLPAAWALGQASFQKLASGRSRRIPPIVIPGERRARARREGRGSRFLAPGLNVPPRIPFPS